MSPIGPKPHIKEVKPQVIYTSVTCPYCGAENKIPQDKAQSGFTCSGCGKRVDPNGGKTGSSD